METGRGRWPSLFLTQVLEKYGDLVLYGIWGQGLQENEALLPVRLGAMSPALAREGGDLTALQRRPG